MNNIRTIAKHQWEISELSQKRKNNTFMSTEYFDSIMGQYHPSLRFYSGGCSGHPRTHICINFVLTTGTRDDQSIWFFAGRVTIIIKNKTEPTRRKTISKKCKFDQTERSELFHFSNSDLKEGQIFQDDSIVIVCVVETEN